METAEKKEGYVQPLEVVETLVVEVGGSIPTDTLPITIKGKFGTHILNLAGTIKKPDVAATYEVVDGILYCEGDVVVEDGVLVLPTGEVVDGILYL